MWVQFVHSEKLATSCYYIIRENAVQLQLAAIMGGSYPGPYIDPNKTEIGGSMHTTQEVNHTIVPAHFKFSIMIFCHSIEMTQHGMPQHDMDSWQSAHLLIAAPPYKLHAWQIPTVYLGIIRGFDGKCVSNAHFSQWMCMYMCRCGIVKLGGVYVCMATPENSLDLQRHASSHELIS